VEVYNFYARCNVINHRNKFPSDLGPHHDVLLRLSNSATHAEF